TDPRCAELALGDGIHVVVGDATHPETVEQLFSGELFDIVVDDGSHVSSDIIAAFFTCFPHVSPGGVYLVEDLHTSYWPTHGGGLRRPCSAMEFLKSLTDTLNADHLSAGDKTFGSEGTELAALGSWIDSVSFYDSLAAVRKRTSSKRSPYSRAVTGLQADVVPALDILVTAGPGSSDIQAGEITAHALDMQMLGEVRRRRIEAAELHNRLTASQAEVEVSRREIGSHKQALQAAQLEAKQSLKAAQLEAERHVSRARVQRDRARLDLSREVGRLLAAVADAVTERDAALAEAEAERHAAVAAAKSECDAAVREAKAQRDAAIARAAAVESSGFWRLSGPARRLLEAFPPVHRAARGTMRWVHRTATGELRYETPAVASKPVPEPCRIGVNTSLDTATVIPEGNSGETVPYQPCEAPVGRFDRNSTNYGELFAGAYGLKAIQLPEDARKCLLVPFEGVTLPTTVPRIAVMVHAFYPERLEIILRYITEIPGSPDLFVTTDTESKKAEIESALSDWRGRKYEIRVLPNRGRDIGPKLYGLADVYEKYDLVLHLHTKRSPHINEERGTDWFDHLLRTLVGSEQVIRSLLAAFAMQPKLGLLFADHWPPVTGFVNWGYDYLIARELAKEIGFDLSREEPLEFPSGSMFWARPGALAPLLSLNFGPEDFPEEEGQTDGTVAHAVERLFLRVCEQSGYSWARIANIEISDGEARRAIHVRSNEALRDALRRHPGLFADPALKASARVLPARPETWPLRIAPEFDTRPRVTLMIPTFHAASLFGGIATAHALFERVADALGPEFERRIVITSDNRPLSQDDLPQGWSLVGPTDESSDRSAVLITPANRCDHGLPVRPHDVFFASAWWDAAASFGLIDLQRGFFGCGARLRYFIQDYEPNFSAWSAPWVMAERTYHRQDDTVAIVNSGFLADYLEDLGLRFSERHVFRPLWNSGLGIADADATGREDLLLVYWRPHVERNLGPIVQSALAQWLEQNPYGAQRWRILGIGEDGEDVQLTDWRSMTTLGKLTLSDYRALLRRAKVGLCLMLSPHPSYPPLEMGAFGMRVVTNGFSSKDLSRFGDGIESVPPVPEAIAGALGRATEYWATGNPGSLKFDFNGAFADEVELDDLAGEIATGVRSDVGLSTSSAVLLPR
ncbi:MAG: hypothetical protein JO270_07715, partial [Acidobacteriaceae bacterium]|nr:hypothetical protein [Acidobacteriaceae bacterium]